MTVNVANVLSIHGGVLVVYANSSYPYSYPPAPCDDNPDACPLPGVPHLQADTFRRPIANFAAGVSGTVNLAVPALGNVPLASAYIFYINNPSYFEFAGHVNLDQLKIADIKGDVHGALDLNRGLYDIDASVHACLGWTKISACQDVSGHMSNLGIGACTHVLAFNPGFRYEWGDGLTVFLLGCDDGMGPITENVYNGRTADAAAATGVNLPPGLPSETFWVKGSGAPPAVSVTGPHGEHASGGAGPDATIDTGKIVIMPLASQHETVVALRHPSVGHWTVTPQPGSAVKAIAHADGLHPARVRVAVGGRGRTRTLAYHVGPRPGQNVTFAERAGKVFHVIGGARGTSGLLHFKPAFGPGGPREIVAMISLQGVPSKALVVGHYRAPATPRAAKPPRLRVQRRARAFVVSWGLAANARSYLVQAMLGDGRRVAIPVSAGRRSVSIPAAGRAIGAKISVTGVGIDGNPGLTAVLRLKPPPPPARVRAIRTRVTRSGVVVSWHAVPSAVSYMVRIVIRSRPAREFLLFAPKPRLKPSRALLTLKRGQSAAIEIRAVARNGRVGRAGRGRYVARRR
ncbi:MAG: hypothetical protein ACJ76X_11140 [Solirubrobacteraceae bacterium]